MSESTTVMPSLAARSASANPMPHVSLAADAELHTAVERGAVAGVVAAVTTRDGIVYEQAVGAGGPGGVPMTTEAVFRSASMTKALTCLAAMQVVERGLLD